MGDCPHYCIPPEDEDAYWAWEYESTLDFDIIDAPDGSGEWEVRVHPYQCAGPRRVSLWDTSYALSLDKQAGAL
jgi:hypothetical protein